MIGQPRWMLAVVAVPFANLLAKRLAWKRNKHLNVRKSNAG
ncbi:MAG: hypothetical protein ACREOI_29540 [bacterium]